MEKRTSAFARIFAALALIGAVVVVIAVVSGSAGDSGSSGKDNGGQTAKTHTKPKTKAASYEVKTGDTLTAIAHKTGIPVATIRKLNPEIDPQILIAGETLKLR